MNLLQGDSENIPFDDNAFDVAMVAFGVRNFSDPLKGLSEMRRVIRNGGMIMVLNSQNRQAFLSDRYIISISGIFFHFSANYSQKIKQHIHIFLIQ